MNDEVREPAVAGLFYPAERPALIHTLDVLLSGEVFRHPAPKALIVPHAGYPYSGPVAATAYRRLAKARRMVRRVVLLGPSHRFSFDGLALPEAKAFATPLGEVPVDADAAATLAPLPSVHVLPAAHAEEYSLEVQVPFLQYLLADFHLVPLAVGQADPESVAAVLEALWGGPETLIVVSTDLSRFLDYDNGRRRDARTADRIEALGFESLRNEDACGRAPLRGLLLAARRRSMEVERLALCSSGDTAGTRDSVVGYGAFVVHAAA